MAARLVLGEGFRPEDAVGTAAELVAEVEAREVAFAPEVIAAADRFLADR